MTGGSDSTRIDIGFGWTWTEWVFIWLLLGYTFALGGCHRSMTAPEQWRVHEHYEWLEPGDEVPWPGYLCKEELLEWLLRESDGE